MGSDTAAAARRAGVHVRVLHDAAEADEAARVLERIWHVGPGDAAPAEAGLLVALAHAGNYVAAAFDGEAIAGVTIGFFSEPLGRTMHSHIAGVLASHAGRGLGTAMKLHQRDWCLERGLTSMTWTFDPLIARNAAFNFSRLGVDSTEYLPDFYGRMRDGINAGQSSDRMLVTWPLGARRPRPPVPADAELVPVLESENGLPLAFPPPERLEIGQYAAVRIPPDIESLRLSDPAAATRWREASRDALAGLMAAGYSVRKFRRDGLFLLA